MQGQRSFTLYLFFQSKGRFYSSSSKSKVNYGQAPSSSINLLLSLWGYKQLKTADIKHSALWTNKATRHLRDDNSIQFNIPG